MKKLSFYFTIFILGWLTLGCQKVTQYSLSEQMINHYLQRTADNNKQQHSTAGLLDIDLSFKDFDIDIGRDEKNKVKLSGVALTTLHSFVGSQEAEFAVVIKARPDFDKKQGAVYLKDVELVSYNLQSSLGSINTGNFIPYFNQAIQLYFNNYPVYVLDKSNSLEELAIKTTSHFYVEKGQLIFSWL